MWEHVSNGGDNVMSRISFGERAKVLVVCTEHRIQLTLRVVELRVTGYKGSYSALERK